MEVRGSSDPCTLAWRNATRCNAQGESLGSWALPLLLDDVRRQSQVCDSLHQHLHDQRGGQHPDAPMGKGPRGLLSGAAGTKGASRFSLRLTWQEYQLDDYMFKRGTGQLLHKLACQGFIASGRALASVRGMIVLICWILMVSCRQGVVRS